MIGRRADALQRTSPQRVLATNHGPLNGRAAAVAVPETQSDGGFAVDVIRDRSVVTVRPRGELDLATARELEAVLADLHRSGFRTIVLDLAALDFVDSAGVHLALRWIDVDGLETRLELGHGPARSLFEIAGLTKIGARRP